MERIEFNGKLKFHIKLYEERIHGTQLHTASPLSTNCICQHYIPAFRPPPFRSKTLLNGYTVSPPIQNAPANGSHAEQYRCLI